MGRVNTTGVFVIQGSLTWTQLNVVQRIKGRTYRGVTPCLYFKDVLCDHGMTSFTVTSSCGADQVIESVHSDIRGCSSLKKR